MNTERDTLPFKRLFDLNEAKGHLLAVLYYSSMSVVDVVVVVVVVVVFAITKALRLRKDFSHMPQIIRHFLPWDLCFKTSVMLYLNYS